MVEVVDAGDTEELGAVDADGDLVACARGRHYVKACKVAEDGGAGEADVELSKGEGHAATHDSRRRRRLLGRPDGASGRRRGRSYRLEWKADVRSGNTSLITGRGCGRAAGLMPTTRNFASATNMPGYRGTTRRVGRRVFARRGGGGFARLHQSGGRSYAVKPRTRHPFRAFQE